MSEWKKTFCALCYHNCGLEIKTEGHRITNVRPDREHPRTKGYICRKGMKITHYQDHKERLSYPLKREGDQFVEISWDQAISEIAGKLKKLVDEHGPRALAYMGGGGQGCHVEAGFGRTFLTALGSQYHYSALAQELTGLFWVNGRSYGRQNLHLMPDLDRAENFLVMGWNGYVSNSGVNRARKRINEFAKGSNKQLIVIDPLLSETARQADTHLQIRIGTAALFLKSLIAIILQEGWEDNDYISDYCQDFDRIVPWFKNFDVGSALEVCGVDYDTVKEVARTYATRPTAMRTDLGLLMDRQSTMNSYLEMILMAVCGRIGTPGGNVFNGHLMPLGPHSDERDERTWRTVETDIPAIMGYFPPNVIPEEVLSKNDSRLRAMIISGANPVRSYADTMAYEQAFKELDLLVTIEIAMTETARMGHYVLPARSAFEKWDATFFSLTFPETYFQVRQPCCEPLGDPLEEGDIFTRLADAMGLLPETPQPLLQAADGDRKGFASELMKWMSQERQNARLLPFMVAKTLGQSLNSAHLAAVWGLLAMYPQHAADELVRAGYELTPFLGDNLFQKLLDHPEGILIGKLDPDKNLEKLRTPDKKIHLYIEEMADWIHEVEPGAEKAAIDNREFPLVLVAGRHFQYTANSIMRDPAWNDHKTVCTALMNKEDIQALGIEDGEEAWVTTEASRVKIPVEVSDMAAPGTVTIPHGFGLDYMGQNYGVNINRLTKNTHRDRLAGTPLHRYVPCRVEACGERMQQLKKIDKVLPETMICGRSLDIFLDDIERFHGFTSPGLVLGGFMVDWAQELIGLDVEADAVVETYHCLPDAVQIFTPCTIGNGWLKVLDWDKFALTLYDKRKLNGYRIWLDLKKTRLFPKIYNWYMRRVPKKNLSLEILLEEIFSARRSVLSCRAIQVTRVYGRKKKGNIEVCSICGEAYSTSQGDRCITCQGKGYY